MVKDVKYAHKYIFTLPIKKMSIYRHTLSIITSSYWTLSYTSHNVCLNLNGLPAIILNKSVEYLKRYFRISNVGFYFVHDNSLCYSHLQLQVLLSQESSWNVLVN